MITKCIIDEGVLKNVLRFASHFSGIEWGGALLGWREGETTSVLACFFPPQIIQHGSYCEFDGKDLVRIKNALSEANTQFPKFRAKMTVGWIHTHPGLSVFLSGQDVATFTTITALDPLAVAIVIDPSSKDRYNSVFTKDNLTGFPITVKKIPLDTYYKEDDAIRMIEEKLSSFYPAIFTSHPILISPTTKPLFEEVEMPHYPQNQTRESIQYASKKPWESEKRWPSRKKCSKCGGILDENAVVCEYCRNIIL